MIYEIKFLSIQKLVNQLNQNQLIIYPTESVFGLGCNPDSEMAIRNLLNIKQRSWTKGLILVAANYMQLLKYIDDKCLNNDQKSRVFSTWPGPITWTFPASLKTSHWLTGKFSSIAVRITNFEPVQNLCLCFGKPLVSTSANLTGYPMTRTIQEVYNQLGLYNISMMRENVLGLSQPSQIRDAKTGEILRK